MKQKVYNINKNIQSKNSWNDGILNYEMIKPHWKFFI
jgi:hypothetical protein